MLERTGFSRRQLMEGLAASFVPAMFASQAGAQTPYSDAILPRGIRSRFVDNSNGITMHLLEAGFEPTGRPAVVLVHGFPELAYSWRKVMPPIAAAGYH